MNRMFKRFLLKKLWFVLSLALIVSSVGIIPVRATDSRGGINTVLSFIKNTINSIADVPLDERTENVFGVVPMSKNEIQKIINMLRKGKISYNLKGKKTAAFKTGKVWGNSYTAMFGGIDHWTSTASECLGFAKMVFEVIFAYTYDKSNPQKSIIYQINCPNKEDKDIIMEWVKENVQAGDYIRYGGHSAIVYDKTETDITIYENNHRLDNGKYDLKTYFRSVNWSAIKSQIEEDTSTTLIIRSYASPYAQAIIPEGIYTLSPKCAPDKRLDVSGGDSESGTNVQIWETNSSAAQKWKIKSAGNGYYYLYSEVAKDRNLDVNGGLAYDEQNVQLWESNQKDNQKWKIVSDGWGYYYLYSGVGNNMVLDDLNKATKNGSNVAIYQFLGSDAQKWKLIPEETSDLKISDLKASQITQNSVKLSSVCRYTKTRPIEVGVEISEDGKNWAVAGYDKITHALKKFNIWYDDISGLKSGTTYRYRFFAKFSKGSPVVSDEETFVTRGSSTKDDSSKYITPRVEETPKDTTREGAFTVYVTGTDGSLVINSKASAGYGVGEIPECAPCTVYPNLSQGVWYYVNYNGIEGYSHSKYLTTNKPSYKTGIVHDTDGELNINKTASTKYPIGSIPEGEQCKVYASVKSGKWIWVEYNGTYGYSWSSYIKY